MTDTPQAQTALKQQAAVWLANEDKTQHEERCERLVWIAEQMPEPAIVLMHGGWATQQLFEEAKYCFVYGQYLSSIILSFAWVERTLASLLYAVGDETAKRMRVAQLLKDALRRKWLTDEEFNALNSAREIRNNVTHFRGPLPERGYEERAVKGKVRPHVLAEEDSKAVLVAALNLIKRAG